jgi:hypothetical protein
MAIRGKTSTNPYRKEFGAMDMLKLEMVQLESHTEKLITKLGSEVYSMLMKKRCTAVSRNTPAIRGILRGIEGLLEQKNSRKKSIFLSTDG